MAFVRTHAWSFLAIAAAVACGAGFAHSQQRTVQVESAFVKQIVGHETVLASAIVQVRNTTGATVTVWKCRTDCACASRTEGLPIEIAPGRDGAFLLHADLPATELVCELVLLTDSPVIRGCYWDVREAAKLTVKDEAVINTLPIPDPFFSENEGEAQ